MEVALPMKNGRSVFVHNYEYHLIISVTVDTFLNPEYNGLFYSNQF